MKIQHILISSVVAFAFNTFATNAQTKVIAHRGYWKTEGSAQNSIKALERANEIKAFGSECDIWLASDGTLAVFHDGTVNEKGENFIIEKTPYSRLKEIKLANGEGIPSFESYLKTAKKCKNTKLIIELKSHSTKAIEDEAVRKTLDLVKKMKLTKRVEYISFSLNMVKEIIRLDPKAKVAYLSGNLSPKELKEIGCTGLDYHFNVLKSKDNWIKEAKDLGLTINVWTVDDEPTMRYFVEKGVDYITTDEPELLQKILNEKK